MIEPDPPKPTPPPAANERVIANASSVMALPARVLRSAIGILKRAWRMLSTRKQLDDADELRQTRVRRQLRGLPPDHDPSAPRSPK